MKSNATDRNKPVSHGHSLWREGWGRLWQRPMCRLCLGIIALFACVALYGEIQYRYYQVKDQTPSYQQTNLKQRYQAPGWLRAMEQGSWHDLFKHPMGTDNLGRDVFQRVMQGARIAFHVGIVTSLIAIPIGVILGCLAGYFGGRVDAFIMWLYSSVASMPGLLFILAIAMLVGKGLVGVYLGIGLTTWVSVCRLVRAEVIKQKDLPYVQAARVLGYGPFRILFRHILPNVAHIIIIVFSIRFPAAVGTEVFISFLGIGVQNEPSWGIMINNARLRLWQGVWWELTFVSLAIFLLVLAFNLLGDALRDAFDPRLRLGATRSS
jgi:peptide/nickel transport system permease protein